MYQACVGATLEPCDDFLFPFPLGGELQPAISEILLMAVVGNREDYCRDTTHAEG